jgi:DNA invertase Pin-like site-specific DNA recombinase
LAILDYANKNGLKIDNWIEIKASSRKSPAERRIDELVSKMNSGDVLIVAELSRLGRWVFLPKPPKSPIGAFLSN